MMMLCVHSTTTDFVTRDSLLMHPKYVHQKKKKVNSGVSIKNFLMFHQGHKAYIKSLYKAILSEASLFFDDRAR